MAEEDNGWIYDSVVGFLNSPIWMVPIESFVDTHCLVFDNTSTDVEEYKLIHVQYKELVEELLEGFTNDLHITSQQFIEGCEKGRAANSSYTQASPGPNTVSLKLGSSFQSKIAFLVMLQHKNVMRPGQGMFEYVFASVNEALFKSIMVRHNAALSLQALQMIRGGSCEGEADLEAEVMKFSEQEYNAQREEFSSSKEKEMADLEAALQKSRIDCETLLKDIEKDKSKLGSNVKLADVSAPSSLYPNIPEFVIEDPGPAAPPPTGASTATNSTPAVPPAVPAPADFAAAFADPAISDAAADNNRLDDLPPLKVTQPHVSNDAAKMWMDEARAESATTEPPQNREEQSIEDRKKYWLDRKQALVAAKKSQGLDTLTAHGPQGLSSRPKSARVAIKVVEEQLAAGDAPKPEDTKAKAPAMSQALAAALRREVIDR